MAFFQLFPCMEQLFVIVLAGTGRVDAYPDMLKALILMEQVFDLPGIGTSGKVVVHVNRFPVT